MDKEREESSLQTLKDAKRQAAQELNDRVRFRDDVSTTDDDSAEEEEEVDHDDDDDDEEEVDDEDEVNQYFISESRSSHAPQSALVSSMLPDNARSSSGAPGNSAMGTHVGLELKEQAGVTNQVTAQGVETQTDNQPSSVGLTSTPTSLKQPASSVAEEVVPVPKVKDVGLHNSSNSKALAIAPIAIPGAKSPIQDGYNWRKYGQKQVKSPQGSRSYYRCTHSDCCAKKIECCDHSGHVIDVVNKGMHSHDPPQKNSSSRENRVVLSPRTGLAKSKTDHPTKTVKDSAPARSLKEPLQAIPIISDKKRQNLIVSEGDVDTQAKEEHVTEPEPKRRVKKGDIECSETLNKPGKKPKFVVHAAGDVGISGDGYRWRKYGQKMVKGKPHPRNYYRCTSAGCPARKHIETAVDNTNAVIITYKGAHDHDTPVPKKRHGNQRSAPLIAAATTTTAPQLKKTDTLQNQWSVSKEGELKVETLDRGGEKEKTFESARTLLSIGFEIKPC